MQLSEIEPGLWLYSDQQAGMESYCHGLAECLTCNAEWVAVWPLGADESKMITLRTDESGKPTVWCDPEIADLVDALNTDKLSTVASCSGHGHRPGRISLKDGRELLVMNSEQVDVVERLFGTDINGQSADDFANAEAQEAVAYGLPNTAITGKKQALMQVRLDIPSNDQYGGALWVPLYLSPPTATAIAAMVIRQAAEILDSNMFEYTCKAGITKESMKAEILALTPAAAEAELEALMMKVATEAAQYGAYPLDGEWLLEHMRAIVRRVLDGKGE
jgi:hypothetical protein